jgi:1-phosphofructokinase
MTAAGAPRVVTLTPNPSLDRALHLDRLAVGEVNRAAATHLHPGGKGINVSRALAAHGVASRAVMPSGGPDSAVPRPSDVRPDEVALVTDPDPALALKEL